MRSVPCPATRRCCDLSRALRELAARANAARVTLYAIDGAGLTTLSSADVSYGDRRFTPSAHNDLVLRTNLRAGPSILADQTGGVAAFDANRPAVALSSFSDELHGRRLGQLQAATGDALGAAGRRTHFRRFAAAKACQAGPVTKPS
jgi:hypothetical protein